MTKIAMILGHDLLEPNEDNRVYREALTLVKADFEVTVFCWARRMEKYETKWEVEKDGIEVYSETVALSEENTGDLFLYNLPEYGGEEEIRTEDVYRNEGIK